MPKTRVHELAREYGTESRLVLARLKDLGVFIKSASSPVESHDEARLRAAITHSATQGVGVANFFATKLDPVDVSDSATPEQSAFVKRSASPRRTSWTGSDMAPAEQVWRRAGLGDNDAALARFLLEHGILPEDLDVRIRGTRAVNRLRSGEASWRLLVDELREARDQIKEPRKALPDTRAVTRRRST